MRPAFDIFETLKDNQFLFFGVLTQLNKTFPRIFLRPDLGEQMNGCL